ncbi:MAG: AraC family transcriptional regulator [Gammaproteobacteria bacterium]
MPTASDLSLSAGDDRTDVLSDILSVVRLRSTFYFRAEFTPPWSVLVPNYRKVARFHVALRRGCWARIDKTGPLERIEAGDLVIIPHGSSHVLSDDPSHQPKLLDVVLAAAGYDGGGDLFFTEGAQASDASDRTILVCGHFEFDERLQHPFFRSLPQLLVIRRADVSKAVLLEQALHLIEQAAQRTGQGAAAIVNRLTEVFFIEIIRLHIAQTETPIGYLGALSDPQIAAALRAMHTEPQRGWTVDSLADIAHLSRARFALRFNRLVGQPPLAYLRAWRMQKAAQLIRLGRYPLVAIAHEVGYDSPRSFNRVFIQMFGMTPKEYGRRAALEP